VVVAGGKVRLKELYDDNSGHLEAEADEETRVGGYPLGAIEIRHNRKEKSSVKK
jgi:hypothetical protein